jgi:hypothetical protein
VTVRAVTMSLLRVSVTFMDSVPAGAEYIPVAL